MAKKKAKKSSSKTKSSGPLDNFDYSSILSTLSTSTLVNHVLVHVKLAMQWSYLNFSLYIPVTTPFEVVRQKILERHRNSISDVYLFLTSPDPKNQVSNLLSTFIDHQIEGLPYKVEPPAEVEVYYNFGASSLALDQLTFDEHLHTQIGQVLSLDHRVDVPTFSKTLTSPEREPQVLSLESLLS
ncbi:hypothetical protein RCL1_005672 [Eukaryota sp. TZLM3-RCL]